MTRYLVVFVLFVSLGFNYVCADGSEVVCNSNKDCSEDKYCQFSEGECGKSNTSGKCILKPEICTMDYTPVCGCDLVVYPNRCKAASQGISILNIGECR